MRDNNPVGRGRYAPSARVGGNRRGLVPYQVRLPWIPDEADWRAILDTGAHAVLSRRPGGVVPVGIGLSSHRTSPASRTAAQLPRTQPGRKHLADRMFVADGANKSTTVARGMHRRAWPALGKGDNSCNWIARFFAGLDTSKLKISVALAEEGSARRGSVFSGISRIRRMWCGVLCGQAGAANTGSCHFAMKRAQRDMVCIGRSGIFWA